MPATAVTVRTEQEVKLAPGVRRKLLTELKAYAGLKTELKALEAKVDARKAIIASIREDIGEQSIGIEGFQVTLVAGVRSKLMPEKLIALGVTTAQIEMATVTKPNKPYVKISVPGEKDRSDD
jgi:hypothetical protein